AHLAAKELSTAHPYQGALIGATHCVNVRGGTHVVFEPVPHMLLDVVDLRFDARGIGKEHDRHSFQWDYRRGWPRGISIGAPDDFSNHTIVTGTKVGGDEVRHSIGRDRSGAHQR